MVKQSVGERQFELMGRRSSRRSRAKEETERENTLPILFARQTSHSALSTLERCPRSYWLRYPGAWRGWEDDAPALQRRLYWWSKTKSWQAWAGVLVHDFCEQYFYHIIDQAIAERTGVSPVSVLELSASLKARFEGEWNQSKNWTAETFRLAYRNDRPVWILEHARDNWSGANTDTGDSSVRDARWKRTCWHWVESSVEQFLRIINASINNTPFEDWLFVEGRRMVRGMIVSASSEATQAQAILRAQPAFPKAVFVIDGETWEFGWSMDFLAWSKALGKYIVLEFKSGKPRYWESHRKQLASYAALLMREGFSVPGLPPFSEENVLLRALYTSPDLGELSKWEERAIRENAELGRVYHTIAARGYLEWEMEPHSAATCIAEIEAGIRKHKNRLLRLDELQAHERQTLRGMLQAPLFSGRDGLFVDVEGSAIQEGIEPSLSVALPENYPPTAAINGELGLCNSCDQREGCKEGLAALKADKRRT